MLFLMVFTQRKLRTETTTTTKNRKTKPIKNANDVDANAVGPMFDDSCE